MSEKKTGWSTPVPPEVDAEHQAKLKKERMRKNPEKEMMDEASIHWLGPDDDVIDFLEHILKESEK